MLPDSDLLLPSSVAGVISASRNMIRCINRRAMMASGETSAAVSIARSAYASMPRADDSDESFDYLDSDTESESSLPALCDDDDDEEENYSEEEED